MAARDFYHEHVKTALTKDGWKITHDPYLVEWLGKKLQIDLGAERLIAAEKGDRQMDKLDRYRGLIESKLSEIVALFERAISTKQLRDQVVFDRQRDNYLIVQEGWDGSRRIHSIVVHIEIINGKIVIQEDWTEHGLARELEEAGVPKSDIVLGFQPPDVRPLTGYAEAA